MTILTSTLEANDYDGIVIVKGENEVTTEQYAALKKSEAFKQHFDGKYIYEGLSGELDPNPQTEAKTEAVIKGLLGEKLDVVPNMETTNKALKAASLPAIKADDRDAIIAKIQLAAVGGQ